jgi:cytochrome c biogenesis protein CcmG/thiol:disulfide interchange protein DsbE
MSETPDPRVVADAPRLRLGVILTWIFVIGLLGVLAFGLVRTRQGPVAVGTAVPDFSLTTFEGDSVDITALRGQVVLVNFWASWCTPCEDEALALEQAWRTYRERGVVFLGVNYVDTRPEALAYLEQFGITYPNGPDLGTRISQDFRIRGVPETYIVDAEGVIAGVKIGPYASLEEIEAAVDTVLNR